MTKLTDRQKENLATKFLIKWQDMRSNSNADFLISVIEKEEGRDYTTVEEVLDVIKDELIQEEKLPVPLVAFLESVSLAELREAVRSRFPNDRYSRRV